jgi:hypothetical protein
MARFIADGRLAERLIVDELTSAARAHGVLTDAEISRTLDRAFARAMT